MGVSRRPAEAQGFLPLTEAAFFILASLSSPRHGYAIIQDVDAMSHGRVVLGPGTLYGALQRLLKQGLVERTPDSDPEDPRRKLYRLTPLGQEVLGLEVGRIREMVGYGELALGLRQGGE